MLPRWVRPENELTNQPYSSVVFAVDSFDQHAHFLRTAKTMAAFGRLATTREWTDRPPITQCHRCWRLDHRTTTCQQSPRCRICGEEHEESRHYNPLVPTTDDAEMQVDQDARANQLTNPSCINCKRADLEATDHPANWTRCPERLRHIGNLRDKTKSRSKPKSAKPLPGNNSTPVPTSSNNINRYRPLADTTPSIENILQSAQQRHMNRITEETAQQALADIQKTLSK